MASLSNINGKFVVEQTTGYVGVGTTDPNFLIEAAGANSEIALNSTSASIYRLRSTSSDSFIITKNGVGDRLVINGAGNATFAGTVETTTLRTDVINNKANSANIIYRSGTSTLVGGGSTANKLYVLDSGNIGIGTTAPGSKLEVITSGANSVLELDNSDSNYTVIQYNAQGATKGFSGFNAGFMLFGGESGTTTRLQSGGSYAATILTNGNFGIGTNSPKTKLEVIGGLNVSTNTTSATTTTMRIGSYGASSQTYYGAKLVAHTNFTSTANTDLSFDLGSLGEVMRLHCSGSETRVGIGTTSPAAKLHVENTNAAIVYVKSTVNNQNASIWFNSNSGGTQADRWEIGTNISAGTDLEFFDRLNSVSRMVIQNDGNVGIGTTSPTSKLSISGSQAAIDITRGNSGDSKWEFSSDSTALYFSEMSTGTRAYMMTIKETTGNVGIGTTSPTQKLEVTGNFKLNGTVVQEGTGNNLTFKYRTANSSTYTGGNATCKFGRFYWTPAHWVNVAPVIKVTLHCKYYQGERREYIIKAGYQDTDPIINELQPSSTSQRITLVVGATTAAGYNYAGQPVYYVDLQWVQTSYIWGWAQIESQVPFLTSNPTSGWGGVVMDSGLTQTNGGLVTNNTSFFAGNLGVGTELPTSQLYVNNTVDGDKIRWGKSNVLVGSVGTYNGVPYIGYQGGAGGGIMFNGTSIEPTALGSNRSSNINDIGSANYRWRNAYLGGGIYLGGTATAHKLDFYKTDTWAPQIYYQNATDQANATNSTQTGIYTKIGNVCTVQFRLIWNQASGTPAVDNIGIKNLPFGGNTTQAYAEVPCILIGYTGGPSPRGNLTLTLPGANQTLALFNDTNNVGNMGNAIGSGTKEIRFSFTYLTN